MKLDKNSFNEELINLIGNFSAKCIEARDNSLISERIYRGRATSKSALFEELFSTLLENCFPEEYSFLVDCPITLSGKAGDKRSAILYPDICIIKGKPLDNFSILSGIIELKIDLGWISEKDWESKHEKKEKDLANTKEVTYKGNHTMQVSDNRLTYVIVLSNANHKNRLQRIQKINNIFVLCMNFYPNDHSLNFDTLQEKLAAIKKDNQQQWDSLYDSFSKNFSLLPTNALPLVR